MDVFKSSDFMEIPERNRYHFEGFEIGEHFFFGDFKQAESARVAGLQFARRRGLDWKFGIRKMQDGWRVFRLA